MGIIKISDNLHEQVRISSKAMTRSINAQAEHWIKIGMLSEKNPNMSYLDLCAILMNDAQNLNSELQSENL